MSKGKHRATITLGDVALDARRQLTMFRNWWKWFRPTWMGRTR